MNKPRRYSPSPRRAARAAAAPRRARPRRRRALRAGARHRPPRRPRPHLRRRRPPPRSPGRSSSVVQLAFGKPAFAWSARAMVVRGIVTPYVAGQKVKVSFYRDGRKVGVKTRERARRSATAPGSSTSATRARSAGLVQARVAHYATPQQAAFTARSESVRFAIAEPRPAAPAAVGPAAAVRAQRAPLRRAAERRVRRRDRARADRLSAR